MPSPVCFPTNLETLFPKLKQDNYAITSPKNEAYNCVAWAAGDVTRWWWPGDPEKTFWPAEREETLNTFLLLFRSLGFTECETALIEAGFEKIALFANLEGNPTHAARQLANGRWTSKLGMLEDLEHELQDLEGQEYGAVKVILKKPAVSR